MIRWLDEAPVRKDWLGQTYPATEGTTKSGFSTVEKILLASVIISGVGLVIHLWELTHAR